MYHFLRKYRKVVLFMLIPYVVLVGLFTIPIDYHISAPGNLSKLDKQVEIANHNNSYEINTVYVITLPKVTLFQAIMSSFYDYLDLEKNNKNDVSSSDSFKSGQVSEELSYQYAIIQAYEAAALISDNIEINYSLRGYVLSYRSTYQKTLEIGDIITKIEGVSYKDVSYEAFLKPFKEKNRVLVQIIRNEQIKEFTLNKDELNQTYGLYIEPIYDITSTPSFKTNYKDDFIDGPSGGLMQSLYIYCLLLDVDLKGLSIAGTGTIDVFGTIGEIGGIKQKVVTTYRNKDIDVFYVGKDNYQAAKKTYDQLKKPSFSLVEVGDFSEVIADLLQRI